MTEDRDIARRALDMETRARDFRVAKLAGYMAWSKRKLAAGESVALIAHLDDMSIWLLPEDAEKITEQEFEEYLADLKSDLGDEPGA